MEINSTDAQVQGNPIKRFGRSLGRYILIFVRAFIKRAPYSLYYAMAYPFFLIGHCVMINKRRIAEESLRTAFGHEKSPQEIKQIARDCFNTFGWGMIELIYFVDRPRMIEERITVVGKEYLDEALKGGHGAIFIGAHFGNFILMYMKLIQLGYPTNVIMKRTRDKDFEKYISDFRNERGIKTIYDLPPRQCVQQSIRALRNNEILFILLDQNYGGDGRVFVDFFGHKAATATGPVVFSSRTGAPVLPIYMRRDERGHHQLVIEPPVLLNFERNDEEEIVANVEKLTKIIEQFIRRYPHEWGGWMHKRWKSRTIAEQTIIDRENEGLLKNRLTKNWIKAKP